MTTWLAPQLRPSSGLPDALPDLLRGGLDVFRASFWEAHQARWPWLLALVVALGWYAVEQGVRRTRAEVAEGSLGRESARGGGRCGRRRGSLLHRLRDSSGPLQARRGVADRSATG